MIGPEDSYFTYEYKEHYKILPQINDWDKDTNRIKNGKRVNEGFVYASNNNVKWLTNIELETWLHANHHNIGKTL